MFESITITLNDYGEFGNLISQSLKEELTESQTTNLIQQILLNDQIEFKNKMLIIQRLTFKNTDDILFS